MSRRKLVTEWHGRTIEVVAGWDRPLKGYFLVITFKEPADDEDEVLFSNLNCEDCHPKSFDQWQQVLQGLGIDLPKPMLADLMMDGIRQTGNEDQEYAPEVRDETE